MATNSEIDATQFRSNKQEKDMRAYMEHGDEGFLYAREWDDDRLKDEFDFVARLLHEIAAEADNRSDWATDRSTFANELLDVLNRNNVYEH